MAVTPGDCIRRYLPLCTAAFAAGVAIAVGLARAIDEATRTIGQG